MAGNDAVSLLLTLAAFCINLSMYKSNLTEDEDIPVRDRTGKYYTVLQNKLPDEFRNNGIGLHVKAFRIYTVIKKKLSQTVYVVYILFLIMS